MKADKDALPLLHEGEATTQRVSSGNIVLGEDGDYYRARADDYADTVYLVPEDPSLEEIVDALVQRAQVGDELATEIRSGRSMWPIDRVTVAREKAFEARKRAREVLADG